jgi:hypothetical protein
MVCAVLNVLVASRRVGLARLRRDQGDVGTEIANI